MRVVGASSLNESDPPARTQDAPGPESQIQPLSNMSGSSPRPQGDAGDAQQDNNNSNPQARVGESKVPRTEQELAQVSIFLFAKTPRVRHELMIKTQPKC